MLGDVNKLFVFNDQQCFAFTTQANFPTYNLNFTEGKGDEIKLRLPSKIFSTLSHNQGTISHHSCSFQRRLNYLEFELLLFQKDYGLIAT